MANQAKEKGPPREIVAPKSIAPIMQAFHAASKEEAISLIKKAVQAILGEDHLSKQELKGIIALMSGFKPTNSLETFYAAQMIVCHVLGMRKMANAFNDDRKLGLKLLEFSNEAVLKMAKGTNQNVTVHYQ